MTLTPAQLERLHFEDGLGSTSGEEGASDLAFRAQLRRALTPAKVPALAAPVMEALGEEGLPVGEALCSAAGDPPALWPGVAAQIDAPVSDLGQELREALLDAAESTSAPRQRRRWPWVAGIAAAAAAAAALILSVAQSPEKIVDPVASAIEPMVDPVIEAVEAVEPLVHQRSADVEIPGLTEIESLESETAAVLQVLQFDENAPTIIFVDED